MSGTLPKPPSRTSRKSYSIRKYVHLEKYRRLSEKPPLSSHQTGAPQLHPTFKKIYNARIAFKPEPNRIANCRNSSIPIIVCRGCQSLPESAIPKECHRQMCQLAISGDFSPPRRGETVKVCQ